MIETRVMSTMRSIDRRDVRSFTDVKKVGRRRLTDISSETSSGDGKSNSVDGVEEVTVSYFWWRESNNQILFVIDHTRTLP